jgi:hypothetical protein
MLTVEQIIDELRERGLWKHKLVLEPFELLSEYAPPGALDGIACYRLIDPSASRVLDAIRRDWIPVAVIDNELLVDASPRMFELFLRASGFFAQPAAFDEDLLTQFHRFAFDFYDSYQVREKSFVMEGEVLVVRGKAYSGAGEDIVAHQFETRAAEGKRVSFHVLAGEGE